MHVVTCSRSKMLQVLLEIHLDDGASEPEADGCARICKVNRRLMDRMPDVAY